MHNLALLFRTVTNYRNFKAKVILRDAGTRHTLKQTAVACLEAAYPRVMSTVKGLLNHVMPEPCWKVIRPTFKSFFWGWGKLANCLFACN